MKTLGISIGASTISIVWLDNQNTNNNSQKKKMILQETIFHEGDSKGELLKLLKRVDTTNFDRFCITGRKFRKFVNLTGITEPEATECSINELIDNQKDYNALVSAGGETIMVYELKNGQIFNVFTGNKCASGTGAFFLQQLGRMALNIDELEEEYREEDCYEISGRCSVFCKSDCTHALNKGIPKRNVIAGLCKMMSLKITELLSSLKEKNVILVGGISKIKPIVKYIGSSVDSLKIIEESGYFEAYGAALWSFDNETLQFPGY